MANEDCPGIGDDSEFHAMIPEELDRQVAVREGEIVERTSVMRAAVRAIALKAAKGDVKAYTPLAAKRDAMEDRRRARQEEILQAVLEYGRRLPTSLCGGNEKAHRDQRSSLLRTTSRSI
jgi:hypothetical protein